MSCKVGARKILQFLFFANDLQTLVFIKKIGLEQRILFNKILACRVRVIPDRDENVHFRSSQGSFELAKHAFNNSSVDQCLAISTRRSLVESCLHPAHQCPGRKEHGALLCAGGVPALVGGERRSEQGVLLEETSVDDSLTENPFWSRQLTWLLPSDLFVQQRVASVGFVWASHTYYYLLGWCCWWWSCCSTVW